MPSRELPHRQDQSCVIWDPPETSFRVNVGEPTYASVDAPEALAEIVPVACTSPREAPERSIVSSSIERSRAWR